MHLMVVIEDRISDWRAKGEILEGYFNPAGAFEKVTILGVVEDTPDERALARLCAPARHVYINAGINRGGLLARSGGLRPGGLAAALRKIIDIVPNPSPDVVRAYGDGLAPVVAASIRRHIGIPFAVSLHTAADRAIQARYLGVRDRFWRWLLGSAVNHALRDAGAVMAVYSPILDYLPHDLAEKAVVVPNVVGVWTRPGIRAHRDGPMRALWLGRQMPGRDPRPIVEALHATPNVDLTLIGDGPYRDVAQRAARRFAGRTRFVPAMDNRALCAALADYDVLVVNSRFREVPKSVIEAALTGLPVIVNRLPAAESAEYSELPTIYVDPSPGGYAAALRDLEGNPSKRRALARETQDAAWRMWNPSTVAEQAADVLSSLASVGR